MANFALSRATPDDCEAIVRIEFSACAEDPGFSSIYPKGATRAVVEHYKRQMHNDLTNDSTCSIMVVRDIASGKIASFATWHFFERWNQDDLDKEMLNDDFKLPADANIEAGNRLIRNGIRRRHEIMGTRAYAYFASMGTSLAYRKQGAASLLLDHFSRLADAKQLPAYVEGTPAGIGIYRKYGFEQVDILKLDLRPWKDGEFYNLCMIRSARPRSMT